MGNPPGANFPVAETFINNVPNGALFPIEQYSHFCLLALLHQYPEQDQQTWTADHSFVRPW
jgi:hypothetical protein